MTANDLFVAMPTAMATRILEDVHNTDKELYRVAVAGVAQVRKLRPIFLERQPRAERHKLMAGALMQKSLEMVAGNLLSGWLVKNQSALLTDFLDGLKIKHQKGVVEELPETVSDADLDATVDKLLATYEPEVVTLYLHAFDGMNDANWPNLKAKISNDSRLKL